MEEMEGWKDDESGMLDVDPFIEEEAARITSPRFLFDDRMVAENALEEELQELEMAKTANTGLKAWRAIVMPAVTLFVLSYIVKIFLGIDAWIKQQERQDMEREMELTGTYVSIDAEDVESAVDPTSGKNITIVRAKQQVPQADNTTEAQATSDLNFPSWLPSWTYSWIQNAPSDDDFWDSATSNEIKKRSKEAKGDASPGSTGDSGRSGPPEKDDDSDGLDVLNGLIG